MSKRRKVIIHCWDGIRENEAVAKVELVMQEGKISAEGESYCYITKIADRIIATDKPRKNSPDTYTFYVYKDKS